MHYPSNIQGVSLADIAAQFGTPVYIYDAQTIVRQVSKLKEYFAGTDLKVKFAAKALTNISILSLLRSQEVGVDAVSVNEARIAIRCEPQQPLLNIPRLHTGTRARARLGRVSTWGTMR